MLTKTQTERTENKSDDASVEKLMADLYSESTEEYFAQLLENQQQNQQRHFEDEKNRTMLFDPIIKKKRDYAGCKKRYGQEMADKMYKAKKNNGRLDPADYAKLMRQQKGTKPTGNQEEKKQKIKTSSFIRLDHQFVRSPLVRKALRKSMMLYLYIRTYIVRKNYKGDKLNLYKAYFKKGRLASSVSVRELAAKLGLNTKTVGTYLKKMAEDGVIKIEKVSAKDAYDNQQHNVYVLGTHDFNTMKSTLSRNCRPLTSKTGGGGVKI